MYPLSLHFVLPQFTQVKTCYYITPFNSPYLVTKYYNITGMLPPCYTSTFHVTIRSINLLCAHEVLRASFRGGEHYVRCATTSGAASPPLGRRHLLWGGVTSSPCHSLKLSPGASTLGSSGTWRSVSVPLGQAYGSTLSPAGLTLG